MKKSIIIVIHIIFWLVIWSLNFSFSFFNPNLQSTTDILIRAFTLLVYMIDFYIIYLLLIPYFFNRKKHVKFIVYTIIYIFIFTLIFHFFYSQLLEMLGLRSGGRFFSVTLLTDFYYIVLYVILGSFFRFSIDGFRYLIVKDRLEKQNLASELALLRSQVNPHFLFNTLNNIHSMIHNSPKKAEDSIIKLSGIMRYMLYDSNTELVPLDKEISFLNSYISLLQLRVKDENFISSDIDNRKNNIKIAPMLLVPFVENAYKHGNKSLESPGITIILKTIGKKIIFRVDNLIPDTKPTEKDNTKGIGLQNIKRRLELIYPGKYVLDINEDKKSYRVNLKIDTS